MWQTTPDDERITEMDPVQKLWMLNHWVADQNEKTELAKNHAYLIASFWNPDAVNKIMNADKSSFASTEEGFEESTRMVREGKIDLFATNNKPPSSINRRRRRHTLKRS